MSPELVMKRPPAQSCGSEPQRVETENDRSHRLGNKTTYREKLQRTSLLIFCHRFPFASFLLLFSALKSVPFTARSAKRSSRLFCDSVFTDEVTSLNSLCLSLFLLPCAAAFLVQEQTLRNGFVKGCDTVNHTKHKHNVL